MGYPNKCYFVHVEIRTKYLHLKGLVDVTTLFVKNLASTVFIERMVKEAIYRKKIIQPRELLEHKLTRKWPGMIGFVGRTLQSVHECTIRAELAKQ